MGVTFLLTAIGCLVGFSVGGLLAIFRKTKSFYLFPIRFLIVIYRFFYYLLRIRKIKHINFFKLTFYLIITELFLSLITLLLGYDQLRDFSINKLS